MTADSDPTPLRSGGPRVLIVYYSYSGQAPRVATAMTQTLKAQGCAVTAAAIDFTDPRYVKNFANFP